MTLVCITNAIAQLPARARCRIRGQHYDSCNTDTCTGCVPRSANHGLLCWSCWTKLQAATAQLVDQITHLRSIERGPADLSGVRGKPGSRVILPGSWQAANAVWGSLCHLVIEYCKDWRLDEPALLGQRSLDWVHGHDYDQIADDVSTLVTFLNLERLVTMHGGAAAAVELVHEVQRALASYPMDPQPRPVRYIKCRTCEQQTLWEMPPLTFLDPITIQCRNRACGAIYDPQMIEFDLRVYVAELQEEEKRKSA